jgi:hypothetical protein
MKKNINNLIKYILKDISKIEKVHNTDNIFNIEIFNIKILIKNLGKKIIALYSFLKKNNNKTIINYKNIFESIKINFNRLSYSIMINTNKCYDTCSINECFNKDTFYNHNNFFMNKKTIKSNKNKYVSIINSSYNLRNILLKKNNKEKNEEKNEEKKKNEEENVDYNILINHYLEKLYSNFDYINELSNKTCKTSNKTNKIFNYTCEDEDIFIPKLKFKKNYLCLLCIFIFCIYFCSRFLYKYI